MFKYLYTLGLAAIISLFIGCSFEKDSVKKKCNQEKLASRIDGLKNVNPLVFVIHWPYDVSIDKQAVYKQLTTHMKSVGYSVHDAENEVIKKPIEIGCNSGLLSFSIQKISGLHKEGNREGTFPIFEVCMEVSGDALFLASQGSIFSDIWKMNRFIEDPSNEKALTEAILEAGERMVTRLFEEWKKLNPNESLVVYGMDYLFSNIQE